MVTPPSDPPPPEEQLRLQDRDLEVLRHIQRYRMTIPRVLERLPIFARCGPYTVANVIRRLRKGQLLRSAWLYDSNPSGGTARQPIRHAYYYLSPSAAHLLGEDISIAQPLKDEPKVRAFAILAFCCLGTPLREKLTPQEYEQVFPELRRPGERINYYIDTEGPRERLGYIRVDYGGHGRWDRLVTRCRDEIRRRCDNPEYRKLILEGGFLLTIVTALEQKAERLRAAFDEARLPVDVRVHVVPELLNLIAPPRRPRGN